MSTIKSNQLGESIEKIKANKSALAEAAETDLDCAEIAAALLEVAEDGE